MLTAKLKRQQRKRACSMAESKVMVPTSMLFMVAILIGGCSSNAKTGSLIGAGVGAALGQWIGKDTTGTLIGAGAGAAAGYMVGNEADKEEARDEANKEEKAREETDPPTKD